jgi:hypothetical protein
MRKHFCRNKGCNKRIKGRGTGNLCENCLISEYQKLKPRKENGKKEKEKVE